MAAVTDSEAIIALTFPASTQRALGGSFSGIKTGLLADLSTRQIGAYTGARRAQDCKDAKPVNTSAYLQTGAVEGFIAGDPRAAISSGINTGLGLIPVVGSFLQQIFAKINPFAQHAIAVSKEQGTLCALVPQVNAAFLDLDQEVAQGNISVLDANAALDSIDANFRQGISAITKDSASKCDAGCVIGREVDALVIERKQIYAGQAPWMYYLKHYWWVGGLVFVVWLFMHRVTVKGA